MTGSVWVDAGIQVSALLLAAFAIDAWCKWAAKLPSPTLAKVVALLPVIIGLYFVLVFAPDQRS